jgi:uncharacterized circularly permuted ATP-grasp superfamily protein/uncharacterized alpha-E superfamily protein
MLSTGPTLAAPLRNDPLRLYAEYRPLADRYDEMCAADGDLRPHWTYLVRALEALGGGEFNARCEEARRLLHESGVTYNVYGDQQRTDRLWPLDPLPLLLTSAEWSRIEQGVSQRADLLAALLADLYGPRTVVRRGLLPVELVLSHPGFLRPCVGVRPPRHPLPLYAVDLARTADGTVVAIGDRTQAPSGSGYAIENRIILSRVLPSIYRDSEVHRLALFFRALRAALGNLDPRGQDDPRVVLLTPGPENETYFEHAYLAAYLGYALVQGSDLLVRDDRVWLKTLDGLKPVDVILRRVDDAYCDPLELRADSLLGTPGLLQAARLGNVAIANPLGAGVLENPALMAFLPGIARALLGEDLAMASVPTWWCGDASARSYVLEHLDRLVVKPIHPHSSASTAFGFELSTQERWALAERIRNDPRRYAAQEHVALSTAPALTSAGIEPRPTVLRSFAVAGQGGWAVMPGALCRVAPHPDVEVVSNQFGGVSKDVWVLASEPERQVSLLVAPAAAAALAADSDDVPARVADDLFWLGRYAERTDGAARLLREISLRALGSEGLLHDDALPHLLRALTAVTATCSGVAGGDAPPLEGELIALLHDRRRPGTLRYDIDAVVRVGRSVRDRLSSDTVRVINSLDRELSRPSDLGAAYESLQRVIFLLAAFAGLCSDSMARGQGWRFLEVGRHLERAVHTVGLLRALFLSAARDGSVAALEALLAVAHSSKSYRRRYRSRMHLGAVLDLLLTDESNPRAAAHQLQRLQTLIAELQGSGVSGRAPAARLALDALSRVRLCRTDPADVDALEPLLAEVSARLAELSDEITRSYFGQAEPPHQLVRIV